MDLRGAASEVPVSITTALFHARTSSVLDRLLRGSAPRKPRRARAGLRAARVRARCVPRGDTRSVEPDDRRSLREPPRTSRALSELRAGTAALGAPRTRRPRTCSSRSGCDGGWRTCSTRSWRSSAPSGSTTASTPVRPRCPPSTGTCSTAPARSGWRCRPRSSPARRCARRAVSAPTIGRSCTCRRSSSTRPRRASGGSSPGGCAGTSPPTRSPRPRSTRCSWTRTGSGRSPGRASGRCSRSILAPLSVGVRLALSRWHRAAEITADRAGLLCCGDLERAGRAMLRMSLGRTPDIDVATYLEQLRASRGARPGKWTELLSDQPFTHKRLEALAAFATLRAVGRAHGGAGRRIRCPARSSTGSRAASSGCPDGRRAADPGSARGGRRPRRRVPVAAGVPRPRRRPADRGRRARRGDRRAHDPRAGAVVRPHGVGRAAARGPGRRARPHARRLRIGCSACTRCCGRPRRPHPSAPRSGPGCTRWSTPARPRGGRWCWPTWSSSSA